LPKEVQSKIKVKDEASEIAEKIHKTESKIPKEKQTTVKVHDQATAPLKEVDSQVEKTGSSFKHLKEIMLGSIAGGWIQSGIGAITNGLKEAYAAGMEFNEEQDTMKTVWHSLTTQAPKDGQELLDYINKIGTSTIYSTDTINEMAQSFYHVHSSVAETKSWTDSFVALGSTLHMTNDALAESGEQFAKIVAGGKASAEDMSVMINRFPMFGEALQDATGKSMKQLYAMSAAGKLSATQFEEALEFLGKKYASGTQEAMTSYMGMGMYIKSRWQVMMGEITHSNFDMTKSAMGDIKSLLSDDAIQSYATGISKALSFALSGAIKLLDYLADNRKTVVDIIGNVYDIAKIVGGTIWSTAYHTFVDIAEALGLVDDKGSKTTDPLQKIDDILKNLVAHKTGVENFTKALMAMWAIKKITGWITAIGKAKKALEEFGVVQKLLATDDDGTLSLLSGGKGAKSTGNTAKNVVEDVAENAGGSTGMLSKIKGLFKGKSASAAVSVGTDAMEDLSESTGLASKFSKALPAAKGLAGIGTALTLISSLGDVLGSTKKTIGGNLGKAVGSAGGAWAGGAMTGAVVGTFAGPIGTAVGAGLGAAAGGIAGSSVGKKIGKEIQSGVESTFHPKLNDGVSKATNKLKGGMKSFAKSYQGDMDKIMGDTILLGTSSGKQAEKIQADMNAAYSHMSKSVDSYYKGKQDKSKADLELLVKNGDITQAQADASLANEKKSDATRAAQMKSAYANMQKESESYYKQRQSIESKYDQQGNDAAKKILNERAKERVAIVKAGATKEELVGFDATTQRKVAAARKSAKDKENKELETLAKSHNKNMKTLQSQADANTYQSLKVSAGKEKDLLQKLSEDKHKMGQAELKEVISTSAKQTNAVVTAANKTYNEAKDAADKKYKATTSAAETEYYVNHSISKSQYEKIVANAKAQRDDTVSAAKKQRDDTVSHAKKQHQQVVGEAVKQAGEHKSAVNTETGDIKSTWDKFVDRIAGIWNHIIDGWNVLNNLWGGKNKPHWNRYAVGTGGTLEDQFAVVGEEGMELGYHPSMGIFPLGASGMETTFLPKGTSILPHNQSKQFLSMTSMLPHHADGVFGTISDIFDKVKSSVTSAFGSAEKFIAGGVSGAWKWMVNKTGANELPYLGTGMTASMMNESGKGALDAASAGFKKIFAPLFKKAKDDEDSESAPSGSGVNRWKSQVIKALKANGLSTSSGMVNKVLRQISTESGGNNKAVQGGYTDINTLSGDLAKGLMQTISATFNAYKFAGHGHIFNGFDNLLAALNYAKHAYGSNLSGLGEGHGYANGGWITHPEYLLAGEDGDEVIINPKKASADDLLAQAINARAKQQPGGMFGSVLSSLRESSTGVTSNATLTTVARGGQVKATKSNDVDTSQLKNAVNLLKKISDKDWSVNLEGRPVAQVTEKYRTTIATQRQMFAERNIALDGRL
jgi:tape measure domain-containing protein